MKKNLRTSIPRLPSIHQVFSSFQHLNVLIIGDVMVDNYLWGNVERISPEAPVPVVTVNKKETRLGGAANVALNVKALGANPVLCSVIGDKQGGKNFLQLLAKNKISAEGIVRSRKRVTTFKNRILSRNHQLLRYDEETTDAIDKQEESLLLKRIASIIGRKKIDVVILQDYNKGVLSKEIIHTVIDLCSRKGIPTAVDPKKQHFMEYKQVTLFKPNLRELKEGLHIEMNTDSAASLESAAKKLERHLKNRISLFTLSEKGMFIHSGKFSKLLPAHLRNISDVSGAGDTVISVAAMGLALNLDLTLMAELANIAGGLVCEMAGVVPVNKQQFLKESISLIGNP